MVMDDFRSDTVTRPTPEMMHAMALARVGDDVFGDDPAVRELEAETAALLGKEAAVFVVSGTMSNHLAMRVHVGPLKEVLCDHRAHIHVWEAGAIHSTGAAVAPVAPSPGDDFLSAATVEANARLDNCLYHQPVTTLLSLENTLNGAVQSLAEMEATTTAARRLGLSCHLDGARLWNACAATGCRPAAFAAPFDTISVCLSKGLGAPIGSVLVGDADRIEAARHHRKMLGGGWRQAGLLAAAGSYALRHHRERLSEDHENAHVLARGLAGLGFRVQPPETNMVWCAPPANADMDVLASKLAAEDGILIGGAYDGPSGRQPWGDAGKAMRFVTHMQTPRPAVTKLLGALTRLLKRV